MRRRSGFAGFREAEKLRSEFVIRIDGKVRKRPPGTENPEMPTGLVEVYVREIEVLGPAGDLPLPVFGDQPYPEDTRLRYRFLDLRREKLHQNIMLRGQIIDSLRRRMKGQGFFEFQTPILTASSPEGARDFLVPSRLHPGKFYALPQAPQQYKQLLMMAGFDRYFQIAPCFRDEDPRADRLPGEFYQLDIEMSFVEQDDVFAAMEPVIRGVFEEFAGGKPVTPSPWPRIPYAEAMRKYGSDKPDLRNPIVMQNVSEHFRGSGFKLFARLLEIEKNEVWAHSGARRRPAHFRRPDEFLGAGRRPAGARLYAVLRSRQGRDHARRRPQGDRRRRARTARQQHRPGARRGDPPRARPQGGRRRVLRRGRPGQVRQIRGPRAHESRPGAQARRREPVRVLLDRRFSRCSSGTRRRRRSTSRTTPSRCRKAASRRSTSQDPLTIKAFQYDVACNGYELASGGIRNHRPEAMVKAFEIAGYGEETVVERFGGMYRAFHYGAPPHGGMAAGVDRIVMLLAGEQNLREVALFPDEPARRGPAHGRAVAGDAEAAARTHVRVVAPEK